MTTRAPATQAQIKRAIKAVQALGMKVTGVRPDGTVEVDTGDKTQPPRKPVEPEHKVVL